MQMDQVSLEIHNRDSEGLGWLLLLQALMLDGALSKYLLRDSVLSFRLAGIGASGYCQSRVLNVYKYFSKIALKSHI
jgi:hypothetical protein